MSLVLVKEGIFNTVQDLGREGFRRFGVNPAGTMDRAATRLINILLGNDENEAVLELHFPSGEIHFESDATLALGGGDFSPAIDLEPISNWRVVSVTKKSTLRFTSKLKGERTYLAVKGGFKIDQWLGSKCTNLAAAVGGVDGRRLRLGDRIEFSSATGHDRVKKRPSVSTSLIPHYSRFPTVRILAGAEFDCLTDQSQETLFDGTFVVSKNSDRMGFRLQGERLSLHSPIEMLSAAACFGTIQLLPDGQVIVLMADHQTSGGYPRIAHVIERDLPLLAQLAPNDKVAFHQVGIVEAEALLLEFERDLQLLKAGVELSNG